MVDINELFRQGKPFDGRYKLIRPLSTSGGSADVWLASDINTIDETEVYSKATEVAIKLYRPKNLIDVEGIFQFRNEFKKVFNCHHKNIIQPVYFSIYDDIPYLVLPYCPAGSSEKLIGKALSGEDLWKYIYDVSSGLAYLHEHNPQIVHQDIKPANVLIDDDNNFAITDFGISAEMCGNEFYSENETGGTFAYMAPERFIHGTPPMPESDIWAFGATLYELITGDAPFGNCGGSIQKKGTQVPVIKQDVPDEIKQLVGKCLSFQAKDRPSARDIVDSVLKKKYDPWNKKKSAFIAGAVIAIIIGFACILTKRHAETHLNSLIAGGDSIVNMVLIEIEANSNNPSLDNITEFENAKVFYKKASADAKVNNNKKNEISEKINTIDTLIEATKDFNEAMDLARKAKRTEMEDKYMEKLLLAENLKIKINQLINKLK